MNNAIPAPGSEMAEWCKKCLKGVKREGYVFLEQF